MDPSWRMQFTFHGQSHQLPKVRLDNIGELGPRTLYNAAFGGTHPANIEQSLQKSFLCQAYVRLLDLAGEAIFQHGNRVTRKQCIDTFKLHRQWDELGLTSTTTQRERDGGRLASQADRPAGPHPMAPQSPYLALDDPLSFPVLSQPRASARTRTSRDRSPSPASMATGSMPLYHLEPADNSFRAVDDMFRNTDGLDHPDPARDPCVFSLVPIQPGPGPHRKKDLECSMEIAGYLSTEASDMLPPLPGTSLPHTPLRSRRSQYFGRAGLSQGLLSPLNGSLAAADRGLHHRQRPEYMSDRAAEPLNTPQRAHRGTHSWPVPFGHKDTRGTCYDLQSVLSSDGLGFPSYRDRRSSSWSVVDATLAAAMLGPTSDMSSSTPSPSKDSCAADTPSVGDEGAGAHAMFLTSILAGQARELVELRTALARGPAAHSDLVQALRRLEESHRSAMGEAQILQALHR